MPWNELTWSLAFWKENLGCLLRSCVLAFGSAHMPSLASLLLTENKSETAWLILKTTLWWREGVPCPCVNTLFSWGHLLWSSLGRLAMALVCLASCSWSSVVQHLLSHNSSSFLLSSSTLLSRTSALPVAWTPNPGSSNNLLLPEELMETFAACQPGHSTCLGFIEPVPILPSDIGQNTVVLLLNISFLVGTLDDN